MSSTAMPQCYISQITLALHPIFRGSAFAECAASLHVDVAAIASPTTSFTEGQFLRFHASTNCAVAYNQMTAMYALMSPECSIKTSPRLITTETRAKLTWDSLTFDSYISMFGNVGAPEPTGVVSEVRPSTPTTMAVNGSRAGNNSSNSTNSSDAQYITPTPSQGSRISAVTAIFSLVVFLVAVA
ncbi:hypothetical protein SPRG_06237 [Saprolegnia parasitica CBS 223.65]|uniref:Uncharacterized protein n=1 Tax=Saprolegnia parasitica (strain CBS 223.65) TaxID=695850 RepID=A0A067CBT7_SAPPC|nr:hypothetical protein SPRG_06237 [Saprolegnia parasitica CBS 223.65]KDO28189.1 hypothetical protein SPRG_06237 [Saprolegnia parasitica CBS 223.65]|eukprot:XP_012201015.1 hypothetical protein SPRG_06237 [Saprolegnia parasitica CBS 223.65]